MKNARNADESQTLQHLKPARYFHYYRAYIFCNMSKFFKNLAKDVGNLSDKMSIPGLKEQRNALEKEKLELIEYVKTLNARKISSKLLVDALIVSIAANQSTISELLGYFRTETFTPLATAEQLGMIEDVELRALNSVHIDLVSANIKSGEVLASLQTIDPEIARCDAKIIELTDKILKLNEKLAVLRAKN